MAACVLYAAIVLTITAIWVYVGRSWSFSFLAQAMFFPSVLSLFFVDNYFSFITTALGVKEIPGALFYSGTAIVAVYLIVYGCVALDLSLSWAKKAETSNGTNSQGIHEHNAVNIMGFLRASGEEIGWRCFMLPCLLSVYSPSVALFISGVVWGLFHVPVMVLLTSKSNVPKPYMTILVQSVSCLLMAYPIGWLAIKSKYSLWAPSVMHWFWNRLNPQVLGSIYTQTPGEYHGDQWKINGEGLAGCIVILPIAILCVYDLNLGLI